MLAKSRKCLFDSFFTITVNNYASLFNGTPVIIIIMSLFNEDNIFSKYTNLTYGPLKSKNTNST